jgi:YD repeat-containing protein
MLNNFLERDNFTPLSIIIDACRTSLLRISFVFCLVSVYFGPDAYAETYEYDNVNRLTRVTYPDGSYEAYEYDSRGNIVKVIRRAPARPDIEISLESLEFGEITVGDQGEETLDVTNAGAGPLIIARINLPDAPYSVSQDGCTSALLLHDESCELKVSYAPTAPGQSAESLSIVSNDPLDPMLAVQLIGTGIGGDVPSSIVRLGQSVEALNLPSGRTRALNASLEKALVTLEADNPGARKAAANKLRAFVNKIEAASGKTIEESEALELIESAQRIIASLEEVET